MRAEEIEHGVQQGGIAQPLAQPVGIKPGQRQQPLRPLIVAQHPAERGKSQRLCSRLCVLMCIGGGCSVAKNCQPRFQRIEQVPPRWGLGWRMAKRILVVEDNDLNRKLFCDVLKSQGYAVEPVSDGCEALDRARDFVPNLIIMDIQLPNVSGLDLIEAAKADRVLRAIPVLAVTAYAGKGDEERIRDAGADSYLAKPVSIGPFMAAVKALIEKGAA